MIDNHNRIIRGVGTYGNPIIHGNLSKIYFGNYCSISDWAIFDAGFQHDTSFISTFPFNQKLEGCEHLEGHPATNGNIRVGDGVWICDNAMINSGITIGSGAIIGFGAVVTKDVPSFAVVGGVPAKVIKYRFSPKQIESLIKIAYWDWDEEKLKENAHLLMSNKIDEFIKLHICQIEFPSLIA